VTRFEREGPCIPHDGILRNRNCDLRAAYWTLTTPRHLTAYRPAQSLCSPRRRPPHAHHSGLQPSWRESGLSFSLPSDGQVHADGHRHRLHAHDHTSSDPRAVCLVRALTRAQVLDRWYGSPTCSFSSPPSSVSSPPSLTSSPAPPSARTRSAAGACTPSARARERAIAPRLLTKAQTDPDDEDRRAPGHPYRTYGSCNSTKGQKPMPATRCPLPAARCPLHTP
jgi:hypothetical protein